MSLLEESRSEVKVPGRGRLHFYRGISLFWITSTDTLESLVAVITNSYFSSSISSPLTSPPTSYSP